jgi:hypothetical protein
VVDWDACLATARPGLLEGSLLRLVESQEQVATTQLVSSLERQAILEALLERTKPPLRPGTEGLHYLLATPWRYPPLQWGSRYGSRDEPSLFYGSLTQPTILWEAAYYRFVFWYGMVAPPPRKLDTQHTLFSAAYRTEHGLRLQDAPFAEHQDALTDPEGYRDSQALGSKIREMGVQVFEFLSARDPARGLNAALLTPDTLASPTPLFQEAWLGEVDGEHVRFRAVGSRGVHEFPLGAFQVEGRLPQPA